MGVHATKSCELGMSPYKRIIGRRLRSRTLPSQRTEARTACAILNRMTRLGMPDSYRAAVQRSVRNGRPREIIPIYSVQQVVETRTKEKFSRLHVQPVINR